jgi:hypothetical protein
VRNASASINLRIEYYDACLPQIGEALRCIALDQNNVGGFAHKPAIAETPRPRGEGDFESLKWLRSG